MAPVSIELAKSTVEDPKGAAHLLEEAWSKKPAVLVFIRHFS